MQIERIYKPDINKQIHAIMLLLRIRPFFERGVNKNLPAFVMPHKSTSALATAEFPSSPSSEMPPHQGSR